MAVRARVGTACGVLVLLVACSAGPAREQVVPERTSVGPSNDVPTAPSRPPATVPATPTQVPVPAYEATVRRIDPALRARMRYSWRAGCPVPLSDLRHLAVSYVDFDGRRRTGELVVHREVARQVVEVFRQIYEAGYPIRQMRLVDDFGGSDEASMAADNTSAFNCRRSTGASRWSEHAYARAIDINPRENPYVNEATVLPPAGAAFLDRDRRVPGLIVGAGPVTRAFEAAGWTWGGQYQTLKDYQHFSLGGR